MAGRSGTVRTVGYMSPDGEMHLFEKGYKPTAGKIAVSMYSSSWTQALERLNNQEWDALDEFVFTDVKAHWETLNGSYTAEVLS
jgi:hypothetical protein